jgi:formylglycine-generating enzyme required for sulfatase activity
LHDRGTTRGKGSRVNHAPRFLPLRQEVISMRRLLVFVALFFSLPAQAVTIDWVPVGNANNTADAPTSNCLNAPANCGSVDHAYFISKYETTNAQYAELLNAKAASDPVGLYNPNMDSDAIFGGITRSGVSGSFTYTAKAGFANKPVTYVSFYDALRFSNWLNNGQGSGDTEDGAYTITAAGIIANSITRNAGASIFFLPSENEWYKAAYYSGGGVYFDYPTGTDTETGCVAPVSDTGNSANCLGAGNVLATVGAYGLSDSPYGTYDQGGNVWEWNEEIVSGSSRGVRGGSWNDNASDLAASDPSSNDPSSEYAGVGFRVASLVPEPGPGLLGMTAVLALVASRRRRAN